MKEINFVKINPVENMTILVKNKFNREEYKDISQKLMDYKNVFAEQVGFIEGEHLQMMGGEFCGNASRSFATYLAFIDNEFKEEKNYTITCSGCSDKLNVWVRKTDKGNQYLAKIEMPKAVSIEEEKILYNNENLTLKKIDFSGIVHYIIDKKLSKETFSEFMKEKFGEKYKAFGLMFFEKDKMEMTPFVYVKGLGGVWERSCGSGTTALGYYLREKYNFNFSKIKQPGGEIEVSFEKDKVFIDGYVEIVAEGTALI